MTQATASHSDETHIGPYRVIRTLEVAASNEVVLAMSEERPVVIKRLLPGFDAEPWRSHSLRREALAYARLSHPAVLRMYDFLTIDGRPAMVLEFVDGMSLAQLLEAVRAREENIPRDAVMHIAACVFSALAAAHSARDPDTNEFAPVIHRDVNPGNVLLTRDGDVKLSDFGVARLVGDPETHSGMLKGTWGYMAPEQVLDGPVTVRTDVYGGALLVRELLTGEPAFPRGTKTHLEYLQAMADPNLSSVGALCANVPAALAAALDRALRPNPEERIGSAELALLFRKYVDSQQGQLAVAAVLSRVGPERARGLTLPPVPVGVFGSDVALDVDVLLEAWRDEGA